VDGIKKDVGKSENDLEAILNELRALARKLNAERRRKAE